MLFPSRCVGAVTVVALTMLIANPAQATHLSSHDAVVLRYHFVAGQSYAYRLTIVMSMSMAGSGSAAAGASSSSLTNGSIAMRGIARFKILHVDASGGAQAEMSESHLTMTMSADGQTTNTALPEQPSTRVYLGPDGSERGSITSTLGSFDSSSFVTLPASAVAPGARWSGSADMVVPSTLSSAAAPLHVTARYVFSRYVQSHAERAAAIDSRGALQYITDGSYQGNRMHMHITAGISGQSLFGLVSRRSVGSQAQVDMRIFMSGHDKSGAPLAVHEHVVLSMSMQPEGW